jgi:hypothetical protein
MLMGMVMRMVLILDGWMGMRIIPIWVDANGSHSQLRLRMVLICILTLHENVNGCQVELRIILISFFGHSFIPLSYHRWG